MFGIIDAQQSGVTLKRMQQNIPMIIILSLLKQALGRILLWLFFVWHL